MLLWRLGGETKFFYESEYGRRRRKFARPHLYPLPRRNDSVGREAIAPQIFAQNEA